MVLIIYNKNVLRIFLLSLVFSIGCTNTRYYDSLEGITTTSQLKKFKKINSTPDSILGRYFTEEAHDAVKDIPVIDGFMFRPFVVGVNAWSSLAGIFTLNGCNRKVVVSKDHLATHGGVGTFLHEYIHHLDDLDRDGIGDWIDHREFALAFHKLMQEHKYKDTISDYLKTADAFITNNFGIGPLSELIAYIGTWVAGGDGPDYMKIVYRKILKKSRDLIPN